MKRIIYLFGIAILLSSLTGCEKESEGLSRITNYVTFDFDDTEGKDQLGNEKVVIEQGTSYDLSGNFTAMEGEEDVSDNALIEGTVETNTPGYYRVDYSAENADGYAASATKGIFVSDPSVTTNIEGDYNTDVWREPSGSDFRGEAFPATIEKIADGIFYMNRMLGSYYYDGIGYSIYGKYYVHGFIRLHPDNTITALASFSPAWQDTLGGEGIVDGVYDPNTGEISFTSIYAGGRQFHVTYKPQ